MAGLLKNNGKFLYFAYGSNLLASRIHISNPSARFLDIGLLEKYRLDFVGYSNTWSGSPATIVPSSSSHVWGAIWEMSNEHSETLDRQEGVHCGLYFSLDVDVITVSGKIYRCRVYQQTKDIDKKVPLSVLPENRRPSLLYLKTIVKGAQDCGLPKDYVDILKNIKHNGCELISAEIHKAVLEVRDLILN